MGVRPNQTITKRPNPVDRARVHDDVDAEPAVCLVPASVAATGRTRFQAVGVPLLQRAVDVRFRRQRPALRAHSLKDSAQVRALVPTSWSETLIAGGFASARISSPRRI